MRKFISGLFCFLLCIILTASLVASACVLGLTQMLEEENLDDIRKLHNRWKYRKNIGCWMDSWMAHFLRRRRDNERRRDSRCWW